MRNISFALTAPQFYRRQKSVTRRLGWFDLEPGELLCGVLRSQGLKKGESVDRLSIIRVESVIPERLNSITPEDVAREGFPGMKPRDFVSMFVDSHQSCRRNSPVNRIAYHYLPGSRFDVIGFCRVCGCSEFDACEPNYFGETCSWVNERGLISRKPTTLCSRYAFVDRFAM